MAQVLEDFDFKKPSAYPYDQWFNGQIWQIKKGEDYSIKTSSMYNNLIVACKGRGLQRRIQCLRDSIIIKVTGKITPKT